METSVLTGCRTLQERARIFSPSFLFFCHTEIFAWYPAIAQNVCTAGTLLLALVPQIWYFFLVPCLWTQHWKQTPKRRRKNNNNKTMTSMFNRHTDKNASLRTQAEQLLGHPWFHHPFGKVTRWKTLLSRYLACHTKTYCKLGHMERICHPS